MNLMAHAHHIANSVQTLFTHLGFDATAQAKMFDSKEGREMFVTVMCQLLKVENKGSVAMFQSIADNPNVSWGLEGTRDSRPCYTTLTELGWQDDGTRK